MKKITTALTLTLFCSVLFSEESAPLWPEGKTPYTLPIDGETGSPRLQLYHTHKTKNHNGAAVVICPGGGYGGLAKDHEGHQIATWFMEKGVSAFVLHYRLGSEGHHYPTQLADVQRAIRWVRAHTGDYELDPARLAVMGFSAGGHLASMAATLFEEKAYQSSDAIDEESARPDLAILCYPVISLDPAISHGGSRKNLLGPERTEDEALARKLSSENNVTENTPPTFLFQTDADSVVPAENATRFYLALREKKVPAEFHVYQNGAHGVGLNLGDPVLGSWSELLNRWLRVNFFFAPAEPRVAVSGEVILDGHPVSAGVLSFYPENKNLPTTSVRVRRGKFTANSETGPFVGKATVKFEGSIWETTGAAQDRVVRLETLAPGSDKAVEVETAKGSGSITLEYRSR